ncbi:TorF family putative porin [Ferrimonas lipolytica]|uniref:Histidine kinase n=1 Tax=Ferrimonas lipolytica TaxID=2724191 RepID=A0A6H1UAS1_9GAMM|nr:TorF family putative porin [Ferrimonas lipolytica]QIZ75690.1 hypothetical protein HER31_01520 [Ferrimonas lipolytica]
MKIKTLTVCTAMALGLMSGSALANSFDGNIGATSDYLWRGLSQTGGEAAFSGGIDYSHDSGVYAGTWASNVDFGDDKPTYEIDFYGGYAGEIESISFDAGYIYYAYPNADYDGDFGEVYLNLGWNWFGISTSYGTNAQDDETYEDAFYIEGNISYDISPTLSFAVAVGNQSFDIDGVEDYVNYNASLTKVTDMGDFTFMVSDTDIDDDDPIVLVSWGYGFSL